MTWHLGRLAAFDTETTGVSVENDRIVTAAVYGLGGGEPTEPHEWLADPGVEIPAEATAVHKITTEHAREHGIPAQVAVEQVASMLTKYVTAGAALVGHNIVYDLTLLDRELRRYGLPPLGEWFGGAPLHVLDSRVLDTYCLPYRRRVSETQGARQLITLAQVYGLPWDETAAHGCAYDALIAARCVYRIGALAHTDREQWPDRIRNERRSRFRSLRGLSLAELHARQIEWAAEQAAGLEKHFRKKDPNAVVDRSWPLIPWGDRS